ncbi:PH domain-containing protein [Streptomyces sp. NBC_01262]|jgi:hypothetical protein|uniref:PH domain-containing protein n=1 Tax=Streptomyces sp. NBC_01262 TaxID=2903803 RepID=UPI002E33F327|nr:PH domain-containing protein [Streptomyces sp. NBC_01262]
MTSSDKSTPAPTPTPYAERTYRSSAGIAGGVLLLVLAGWLGGDAVIYGDGHTPWIALAGLLLGVPLVVAFTLRPLVSADEARIRVRNPLRTITAPWAAVTDIRAGYSTELFAGDRKYQLWAIPVSLRARKRAARSTARSGGPSRAEAVNPQVDPVRAWSDQAVDELRGLRERNAASEAAQGGITVRWAYEVIAPAAAGAVVLAVLLAVGG